METDTADIRSFLAEHAPFDALPPDVLINVSTQIRTVSVGRDETVLTPQQHVRHLHIVRLGTIEIRSLTGEIWALRQEGETFGVRALLSDGQPHFEATAREDSVLYLLPDMTFARLRLEYPVFNRFFTPLGGASHGLAHADATTRIDAGHHLLACRVRDVMTSAPLAVQGGETVQRAAALMRDHALAALPVIDSDTLVGMVSLEDLRDGIAAGGVAAGTTVAAVMNAAPQTLAANSLAFDALDALRGLVGRAIPVTSDGSLVGLVTNTDALYWQMEHPGRLPGGIRNRQTSAGIAEIVAQIPQWLVILAETGLTAQEIGRTITEVADATTHRLLCLAEDRLGPPPVPYVWLCAGSQARQEQTGVSDQDNCLILDDRYRETVDGPYFEELARFVCDGLHAAGYVYCPGGMMATTRKWRQPLAQWQRYFRSWISEPEPEAQMLASVMFDLRPVRGTTRLIDDLWAVSLEKARSNSVFIAHIVSNALTHTVPLGFLHNFVLIRGGEHDQQLDLKMNGVAPIVDMARIYALKAGVSAANTGDRLRAAAAAGIVSEQGMHNLLDALEFIATVRIKAQVRAVKAGQPPSNYLSPADLSRIERKHLRDAFLMVRAMQSHLAGTYSVRR